MAQLKKLREKFFPDKKRLTPNQSEWLEEYRKALNRVESWKNKFHAVFDMPNKPETIYKEHIERLKNISWKKIADAEKKKAREEYEYKYEQKMPEIYKPQPPYTPPTEQDYFDNPYYGDDYDQEREEQYPEWDEEDEDGYTETVDSREEIEHWIEQNIDSITVDRELDGVREQLESLILEAADAYGDYGEYLGYLEENASTLTNLAQKAMNGYRGKNGKIYQEDSSAITEFATVLNLNRPLDQSQAERFENEGWISYDFND